MPTSPSYRPAPRILTLGDGFYDEVLAARFPSRDLRFRNQRWAARVGLGDLDAAEWEDHFARFTPLPDNLPHPLALRYHGHQFDLYNPDLGDGRGFLFAQLLGDDGRLQDLGTKGSGTTPWSRGGDGRLTLKGGVREVLATEMLEALGVNTSKTLSLFETGEALRRGDEPSPTRSSVLVRINHSLLRFGTFQRLAHLRETDRLQQLLAYALENYYPALASSKEPVAAFLEAVTQKTAVLAASWMVAGFVHGVLNSDNMTILGESFDYGPYRFLPTYDVDFTAAYFDHQGLYAYGQQPAAVRRNLVRLAGTFRTVAPHLDLGAALSAYERTLEEATTARVLARLGLRPRPEAGTDSELALAVYAFLEGHPVGYDRFFFDLYGGRAREAKALAGEGAPYYRGAEWDALRQLLRDYEPVKARIPTYFDADAPCTLVIDEIERVWDAIAERNDWGPFYEKVERIRELGVALAP